MWLRSATLGACVKLWRGPWLSLGGCFAVIKLLARPMAWHWGQLSRALRVAHGSALQAALLATMHKYDHNITKGPARHGSSAAMQVQL